MCWGGRGGEAYSVHTNDTMLSVCALVPCSPSSRGVFSVAAEQDVGAVNGLAVFSAELALALPNIVSHCLQTGLQTRGHVPCLPSDVFACLLL